MSVPADHQRPPERASNGEGTHPMEGKAGNKPMTAARQWSEPAVVLRLVSMLASLAVITVGFYVWVMKVDTRSHENAKAIESIRATQTSIAATLTGLREEMRKEHERTRRELAEDMVTIGQKIMQLELHQAVIQSHDESMAKDISEATSVLHSHIREGAHVQANEKLETFQRRFDVDDEERRRMQDRIQRLETQSSMPRRTILDLPNGGAFQK
jgi:type II secretory pathway component PulJ